VKLFIVMLLLTFAFCTSTRPVTAATLSDERAVPLSANWRDEYRRPQVIPYPESSQFTAEKAKLGEVLFFDPMLSGDRTRACVSCHRPDLAWGDGLSKAVGDRRLTMNFRSPTLLNVAWIPRLGWSGKFPDIEAVTFNAISGLNNMDLSVEEALARLSASPAYIKRFQVVFGTTPITRLMVEQALATFQRGIVSTKAPFDRWVDGDENAVSAEAKRGFVVFRGVAGCSSCHSGWTFTDSSFYDIGSATGKDLGRGALFPSSIALRYAFKVPTLRDVALRAPYMHDGSIRTLEAVVDLYDRGGIERPSRSTKIKPLGLSNDEKSDLTSFLHTLTGDKRQVVTPLQPR
jgi:cytochrome c peroxidase